MWTAKLKEVANDDVGNPEVLKVVIEYTNGEKTEEVVERISDFNSIKQIAFQGVQARNAVELREQKKAELLNDTSILGEIDFTPPAPTIEQILSQKKQKLSQKKSDLDLGLITQEEYNTALTEVQDFINQNQENQ